MSYQLSITVHLTKAAAKIKTKVSNYNSEVDYM